MSYPETPDSAVSDKAAWEAKKLVVKMLEGISDSKLDAVAGAHTALIAAALMCHACGGTRKKWLKACEQAFRSAPDFARQLHADGAMQPAWKRALAAIAAILGIKPKSAA